MNISSYLTNRRIIQLNSLNNILENEYEVKIDILNENIVNQNDLNILSEFIHQTELNDHLELMIIHGWLFNHHNNQKINNDNKFIFSEKNNIIDNPNGITIHTRNLSFFEQFDRFKRVLENLSIMFKFPMNPFLDRTKYIKYFDGIISNDLNEKPCGEHLHSIKEIFPKSYWEQFESEINFVEFYQSDYKSIKINFYRNETGIIFKFIIQYNISKEFYDNNKEIKIETINSSENKIMTSVRSLNGNWRGFENYNYNEDILFGNLNEFNFSLNSFIAIPEQFDLIIGTLKLKILIKNNNDHEKDIIYSFDKHNLNHIAQIIIEEKDQEDNTIVPFTYENQKQKIFHIQLKRTFFEEDLKHFNFKEETLSLNIQFELRKKVLNFESFNNRLEKGYLFPISYIILKDEKSTIILPTLPVYYNMPYIDETMPFNIIALTWIVYGFIFIQILNFLLDSKEGFALNIFKAIKDRFMSKWGFLFGR